MKLSGLVDYSLGGFLTLRGYAKIGDLAKISIPDKDFQRELIPEHREGIIKFLRKGEFLYFPEIILGINLVDDIDVPQFGDNLNIFFNKIKDEESFTSLRFSNFRFSFSSTIKRLSLYLYDSKKIFSRIDGNHRLSAIDKVLEINPNDSLKELLCPFSIVIFRDKGEKDKFSKVLFNNINSKAVPVTLEHNIKLIIKDIENFNDKKLKEDPSFGWEYYFVRKIYNEIDFDYLNNLQKVLQDKKASSLLTILKYLLEEGIIKKNDNEIQKIKNALSQINNVYNDVNLRNSKSIGLMGAFVYFYFKKKKKKKMLNSFKDWIIENGIYLINELDIDSIIKIYDKILSSKRRTIFVSMPFKDETRSHFDTIERIVNEINNEYNLKVKLKVHRVDWFEDGTSYVITDKIYELIDESGFLIADLTFANPNVYHEVGYLMGRNRAQRKKSYSNFLLIFNNSKGKGKVDNTDKNIAFNLRGLKQIRFENNETLGKKLKENILRFYKLKLS